MFPDIVLEQIFTNSPLRNFSYIVYASDKSRVFCIDPWDSGQIIHFLESRGLFLTHIINTHEHGDHTRGNAALLEYYSHSKKEKERLHIWAHPNASPLIPNMDRGLEAGEKIPITEDSYFEVMDTPGHTFAHISLLLYKGKEIYGVFSGDTFFNAGVGNCYNGGDPSTLYESISSLYAPLPDTCRLYPGHEYMGNNLKFTLRYEANNKEAQLLLEKYEEFARRKHYPPSNIGLERQINLFLRLEGRELGQELEKSFPELKAESSSKDIFLCLRKLRDCW